jgi:hypothetical protein
MDKEMVGRFRELLAKGTKPTIWPSPLLKLIDGPKVILKRKPSMMLHLWRNSSLPHNCVHVGLHKSKELTLISRSRGVLTVLCELSNYLIINLVM